MYLYAILQIKQKSHLSWSVSTQSTEKDAKFKRLQFVCKQICNRISLRAKELEYELYVAFP